MRLMIASLLTVATMMTVACRKKRTVQVVPGSQQNEDMVQPPRLSKEYLQLKPGNYWVYRGYTIHQDGREGPLPTTDTMRVEKDTVIGRRTYHKLVRSEMGSKSVEFLTDSLDYVVNDKGSIVFSASDPARVFRQYTYYEPIVGYDTLATVKEHMGDHNVTINVPVGTFTTTAFIRAYHMRPGHDRFGAVRSYYYRYAKGVGLVSYTTAFYLAAAETFENRLVQYKVQ